MSQLIVGAKAIAAYLGVQPCTIYRWISHHRFPAGKLPNKKWAITPSLIDKWLLARGKALLEESPKASRPQCPPTPTDPKEPEHAEPV
jgi:predicted DNA-binding transcriptional regulator AlpA